MKKHLSKILIAVIMVAIFMAPISGGFKINEIQAQLPGTNVIQYNGPDKETTAAPPPGEIIPANEYGCGASPTTWFTNCIALALYGVIFVPLAELTKVSAWVLDFFVYYSTNSSSYTSAFVSKGWGAVRDVANIFFIIALLYVAIKTILGLNVTDNKKLVGSVIIIALIINFSLFTTKVVIDASNILAKVFYNNITSVDENNKTIIAGAEGEKSISVGLAKQFNPQTIFADKSIKDNIGQFILVTLLSIVMMGFMIYIFLSVAILFVARVISLWLSMIFSPIAFVSYSVPFEIPGLGHKEWWPDLMKNAFLAPLFIFFLYIIIMFADFMNLITYDGATSTNWLDAIMKTIIPFLITFVLLLKAKALAVKFSGDIGKAIQGAAGTIGGLALGGGALLGGVIGRGTIGSFMKGASTGDTLANRRRDGDITLNKFQKGLGFVQEKSGFADLRRNIGAKLNADQEHIQHATHARHELDTAAGTVAHGKKWNELNGEERERVKVNIERDTAKRQEGYGNKTWAQLTDEEQSKVKDRMKVNDESTVNKLIQQSREKQGMGSSFKQSLVGGSYDVRSLSDLSIGEQDHVSNKLVTGITKGIASGLRSGLKSTLSVNYGESQKSFLKDIGHTITEALKSSKVNVNLSELGKMEAESHKGGGGHDAHGGGGDTHSGGHDTHGGGGDHGAHAPKH